MLRWKINFILVFLFLLGMVILGRLFYIQVVKADFYKALAQGLYSIDKQIIGERGEIFFKNGEALAINMDWSLVFSSPIEVKEKEIAAEKLAEILSLGEENKSSSSPFSTAQVAKDFILEKLEKNNLYEPIKKRITDEEIQKIKELNLKGIYLDREKGRYYPQGTFASQLIGFVDADRQGQYGIEGYDDEILRGKKDQRGKDIFLTIDYSIQFRAEKLLEQAKENLEIEGGEIIVMNPDSGEILALANFPNFNPNQYSAVSDFEIFENGATQKIFEPGSIFKPITMAAALNEEKITPQTTYLDKGILMIGGWPISNYDNRIHGEQTMTNVLEKSINTGAVFVEEKLGHNSFLRYLDKFGFFKLTGIDLQEVYSENREFKKGYEINFVTASFGQGIEMTPIQLIRAYSVIANGGKLVKPYLVKKIINGEEVLGGEEDKSSSSPFAATRVIEDDLVISQKTASQLTAMLVSVVENGPYTKGARIPGYWVAGKTGTAQVPEKGTYSSDKTWQSFVGFVPAFNPEFVVLVKLDNPKTKTAEYSAVPIFQDLAKYIVDYYQIPPDHE
ncbi:MAG: penicillin-binding protein 2 [Candidatus Nealsonbacteria bacterium]|nr:penicillin-binding protein 2 [Candidatus Nealsonbacteria bacterium]